MAISMIYYGKSFSMQRKLSVLPIVFGVALAFYGDMSFTTIGAFYTLLCVVLAALKAVVGGELLTGDLKLHEIDLLSKMCPLALLQIGLVSLLTGEILLSKRLLGSINFIYLHICHSPILFFSYITHPQTLRSRNLLHHLWPLYFSIFFIVFCLFYIVHFSVFFFLFIFYSFICLFFFFIFIIFCFYHARGGW